MFVSWNSVEKWKCFFTCLYQSTSQTQYKFEKFCTYLDTLTVHINNEVFICLVVAGDLNARCSKWCNKDINSVDCEIDTLLSSARYKQIINKPTHIANDSSSCTDLTFCNNLNLISNYGVDLSLFRQCHHNIIFHKMNIQIPLPWSYVCEVCH